MRGRKAPRTDVGTVVIHWAIVVCLVVVLGTGLRIASDEAPLRWLTNFDGVLPRENPWFWHIVGALLLTACLGAYVAYVVSARLTQRTRLDATRLATLVRPGPARWASAGVVLLWMFFGALTVELATGLLLFLGQSGWATVLHRHTVWLCLAFPLLHVAFHYAYAGIPQLLRVFRPAPLTPVPPQPDVLALLARQIQMVDALKKGHRPVSSRASEEETASTRSLMPPFAIAGATGLLIAGVGLVLNMWSMSTLQVPEVSEPPELDGDISDRAWGTAPPLTVSTSQGANFGGTGESLVEIRAVHDEDNIYFAFTWNDPTRSYKYLPLTKDTAGWHLAKSAANVAVEEHLMDDKFSVLLSAPTMPFLGAAIHLAAQSMDGYPEGASGRGLHYVGPGGMVDVWVWRADHGGTLGFLDDAHFGAPVPPTADQVAGTMRYMGGFQNDAGPSCFIDNQQGMMINGLLRSVPLRLPRNLEQMRIAMGEIDVSPDVSEAEGARWWMTLDESIPYSAERDASIEIGTTIPSVLVVCVPSGDIADVQAVGRWSAGRWTLETARRLRTWSSSDLPVVSGVMMWVSAFDHAATRHTRHIRAIALHLL